MNKDELNESISSLQKKISELKTFSTESGIDLETEIKNLESKLNQLTNQWYENLDAWQKVQIARHPNRPTTLEFIENIFTDFVELHGDRTFGDDKAIIGGIARLNGIPVTIIGHQKGRNTKENIERNFGMAHPEGYRKSLRLMKQAEKFHRPIICLINTAGAYPGIDGEKRGQSEAIARNLKEMFSLKVPIVCVVTGEGGSGGALALGIGDKIGMFENSFYSVISPEGAAALLWKDAAKAKKAAETMKITASDLLEFNVIDSIISEPTGGAHEDKALQMEYLKTFLMDSLNELNVIPLEDLLNKRYDKYRNIGIIG